MNECNHAIGFEPIWTAHEEAGPIEGGRLIYKDDLYTFCKEMDVIFKFCPICGKQLNKEAEND